MTNNNENNIKQVLKDRFKELPKVVQNAITDSDWLEAIRKITKGNNLLIDQGLVIENVTTYLMFGLIHPDIYTSKIKKEAELTNDQAIKIATEVEDKILKVVKAKIIEETQKETGEEVEDTLPKINTNINDSEENEREDLIKELEGDIRIDDGKEEDLKESTDDEVLDEVNEQEEEWLEETKNKSSNKIPILGDNQNNSRTIESINNNSAYNNLPHLEPLRTLGTDIESHGGIIDKKMNGITVKNTEENKDNKSMESRKDSGPDPYREPIE